MMGGNKLVFNFVELMRPTGGRIFILADLIGQMEEVIGEGEKIGEDGQKTKEKVKVTVVRGPFGMETIVMDTPEQIVKQLESATMESIKSLQNSAAKQLLVPASAVSGLR